MILIHFTLPGTHPRREWKVRLPNVPSRGDTVDFDGDEYTVHGVVWYPQGDEDTDGAFVYVVLR